MNIKIHYIVIAIVLVLSAFGTAWIIGYSPSEEIILGENLTQEQMDSIPTIDDTIEIEINDENSNYSLNDDYVEIT